MVNNTFIKSLIVVLMLGFNVFLILNAKSLNCEDCSVTFSSSKGGDCVYTMEELFGLSANNSCPVLWDRVGGYQCRLILP